MHTVRIHPTFPRLLTLQASVQNNEGLSQFSVYSMILPAANIPVECDGIMPSNKHSNVVT